MGLEGACRKTKEKVLGPGLGASSSGGGLWQSSHWKWWQKPWAQVLALL